MEKVLFEDWKMNLGKLGRDKITGFVGTITTKSTHLYGCDTYLLTPKAKDNKREDAYWFDAGRIEVIADDVDPKDVQSDKPGAEDQPLPETC